MLSPAEAHKILNEKEPGKYTPEEAERLLEVLYKLAQSSQDQHKRQNDQDSHHLYEGIYKRAG